MNNKASNAAEPRLSQDCAELEYQGSAAYLIAIATDPVWGVAKTCISCGVQQRRDGSIPCGH